MNIIPNEKTGILLYANLLGDIKIRIRQAQVKATLSANAEMIMMYWDVGRMIHERQQQEGWSASIIPRLFRNYQNIESFLPQPVAKSEILHQPVAKLPSSDLIRSIPWGHHALLMEKIKENSIRFWYMTQIIQNGWSRDTGVDD